MLDSTELPARVLAAGANLDPTQLGSVPASLHDRTEGVVKLGDDLFGWAPAPPPLPDPWRDPARSVARRIGEDLLLSLDAVCQALGRPVQGFDYEPDTVVLPPMRFPDPAHATSWLRRHLVSASAAVRACGRARMRSLAVALAARLWICAPADVDDRWAAGLTDAGTRAAIDAREPRTFARLLRLSAQWFADRGDFATAEAHGVREWMAWKRLDDVDGMIDVLWHRAAVYRAARRGSSELDCYPRLLSLYRRRGDEVGIARTSAANGSALFAVGRDRDAAEQLHRTVRDIAKLPAFPTGEHAAALETLGRAHWRLGAWTAARRRFHAALRLVDGTDGQTADRIRGLLGVPDGQPLPEAPD
ncbi:hypothetical protein ACQPZF_24780 [Actinosynnema sp. CS-041913]|uniref:hypothetical protein n=1 Tax=Actinosynnema sp. CS-041913 TaxID=3239917 RepID=UPI003D8C0DC7